MESIGSLQLKLAQYIKKEKPNPPETSVVVKHGAVRKGKADKKIGQKGARKQGIENNDLPISQEMIEFMEKTFQQVDSDGVLLDTIGSHLSQPLNTESLFFPTGSLLASKTTAAKSTYSGPSWDTSQSMLHGDDSFLDLDEDGYGVGRRAPSGMASSMEISNSAPSSNLDKLSSRLKVLWLQRQAKYDQEQGKLDNAVNILQDAINEHLGFIHNPAPGIKGTLTFSSGDLNKKIQDPYESANLGEKTMSDNPLEILASIKQDFFLYDISVHQSASRLQKFYHKRYLRKCNLVTKIAKWFRGFRVRMAHRRRKDLLKRCATIIQRQYRWHLKLLHRLATKIKQWYKLRKDVERYHGRLRIYKMARNIQRVFRGFLGRRYAEYMRLRLNSVLRIQRNYRAYHVRSERYFIIHHIHSFYYHAIVKIQCFVRRRLARQRARKQLLYELLRHHVNQHKEQLVMKEVVRMMKLQFLFLLSGNQSSWFGNNQNKVGTLCLLFMKRYLYCEELIMQENFLLGISSSPSMIAAGILNKNAFSYTTNDNPTADIAGNDTVEKSESKINLVDEVKSSDLKKPNSKKVSNNANKKSNSSTKLSSNSSNKTSQKGGSGLGNGKTPLTSGKSANSTKGLAGNKTQTTKSGKGDTSPKKRPLSPNKLKNNNNSESGMSTKLSSKLSSNEIITPQQNLDNKQTKNNAPASQFSSFRNPNSRSQIETFVTPNIIRVINRYDDYYDGQISYRHFYSLLVDLQLVSSTYLPVTHASMTSFYTPSTGSQSMMSSDQIFQYLKTRLDPYDLGYISIKEFLQWYDSKEADECIDSILSNNSSNDLVSVVSGVKDSMAFLWSSMSSWLGQFPSNVIELMTPPDIAYRYYLFSHNHIQNTNHFLGLKMINQYEFMTKNAVSKRWLHSIQQSMHNIWHSNNPSPLNSANSNNSNELIDNNAENEGKKAYRQQYEEMLQDVSVNGNWTVLSEAKLISQEIIMKFFYHYLLSLYRYGTANPITYGAQKSVRTLLHPSTKPINHKGKFTCCQCYQMFALFTDYYQHFHPITGNCPVKQLKGWFFGPLDYAKSHKTWQYQLELQQEIQRNSEEYLYILFYGKYALYQEIALWDVKTFSNMKSSTIPNSPENKKQYEQLQTCYAKKSTKNNGKNNHSSSSSQKPDNGYQQKPKQKAFRSMKQYLAYQEQLLYHKLYPLLANNVEKNLKAKCIDILVDYLFLHQKRKFISEVYLTIIANILALPVKKTWIYYGMIDRNEVINWLKDYWIVEVTNYAMLGKNGYTSITSDPRDDPKYNFQASFSKTSGNTNNEQFADSGNNNTTQQQLPSKEQSSSDGYLVSDPVFPHYNMIHQNNHYANSMPSVLSRKYGPRSLKRPIFTKYQFVHMLTKRLAYLLVRLMRMTYIDLTAQTMKMLEFRGRRPRRMTMSDEMLQDLELHAITFGKFNHDYQILQVYQSIILEFFQEFNVIEGLVNLYHSRIPIRPSIFSREFWRREGKHQVIAPKEVEDVEIEEDPQQQSEIESIHQDQQPINNEVQEVPPLSQRANSEENFSKQIEQVPIDFVQSEPEPITEKPEEKALIVTRVPSSKGRTSPSYFLFPQSGSNAYSTADILSINIRPRHIYNTLEDERHTSYYILQLYQSQSNLLHQQYQFRLSRKYYHLLYQHAYHYQFLKNNHTSSIHPKLSVAMYRIYIKYFILQYVPLQSTDLNTTQNSAPSSPNKGFSLGKRFQSWKPSNASSFSRQQISKKNASRKNVINRTISSDSITSAILASENDVSSLSNQLMFSILDWDMISLDIYAILLQAYELAYDYQNHPILFHLYKIFYQETPTKFSQLPSKIAKLSTLEMEGLQIRLISKLDPLSFGYFTYEALETILLSYIPILPPQSTSMQKMEDKITPNSVKLRETVIPFSLEHSSFWNHCMHYTAYAQFQQDLQDIWLLRIRQERRLLALLSYSLPNHAVVSPIEDNVNNNKSIPLINAANPLISTDNNEAVSINQTPIDITEPVVIENHKVISDNIKQNTIRNIEDIETNNVTFEQRSRNIWNTLDQFYQQRSSVQVLSNISTLDKKSSIRGKKLSAASSSTLSMSPSKKYLSYQKQLSMKFHRLSSTRRGLMKENSMVRSNDEDWTVLEGNSYGIIQVEEDGEDDNDEFEEDKPRNIQELEESDEEVNEFEDLDRDDDSEIIKQTIMQHMQAHANASHHPNLSNVLTYDAEFARKSDSTEVAPIYMQYYPTYQTIQELEQQRLYREIVTLLQQQTELDSYYLYSTTRLGRKHIQPMEKLLISCLDDVLMTYSSALLSPLSTFTISSESSPVVHGLESLPFGFQYALTDAANPFVNDRNVFLNAFSNWSQFVSHKTKVTPKLKNYFFATSRFQKEALSSPIVSKVQKFHLDKYLTKVLDSVMFMFIHFADCSCTGVLDPWEIEHIKTGLKLSSISMQKEDKSHTTEETLLKSGDGMDDRSVPASGLGPSNSISSSPMNKPSTKQSFRSSPSFRSFKSQNTSFRTTTSTMPTLNSSALSMKAKETIMSHHIDEEHTFILKNQVSVIYAHLRDGYVQSWRKKLSSFVGPFTVSSSTNITPVANKEQRQSHVILNKKKKKYWAEYLFLAVHRRIVRQQSEQSLSLTYQGQLLIKSSLAIDSNPKATIKRDKKLSLFIRVQALALRQMFLFLQTKLGKLSQFYYFPTLQTLWKDCLEKYHPLVNSRYGLADSSTFHFGKKVTVYEIIAYGTVLHCEPRNNAQYASKVAKQHTFLSMLSSLGISTMLGKSNKSNNLGNGIENGEMFTTTNPYPMMLLSELPHVIDYLQTHFHLPFLPSVVKLIKLLHPDTILQSLSPTNTDATSNEERFDLIPWIAWDQVVSILCYYLPQEVVQTQCYSVPPGYTDISPHTTNNAQYLQYDALTSYWRCDAIYHMKSIARQQALLIALNFQHIHVPETNYRCFVLGMYATAKKTKSSSTVFSSTIPTPVVPIVTATVAISDGLPTNNISDEKTDTNQNITQTNNNVPVAQNEKEGNANEKEHKEIVTQSSVLSQQSQKDTGDSRESGKGKKVEKKISEKENEVQLEQKNVKRSSKGNSKKESGKQSGKVIKTGKEMDKPIPSQADSNEKKVSVEQLITKDVLSEEVKQEEIIVNEEQNSKQETQEKRLEPGKDQRSILSSVSIVTHLPKELIPLYILSQGYFHHDLLHPALTPYLAPYFPSSGILQQTPTIALHELQSVLQEAIWKDLTYYEGLTYRIRYLKNHRKYNQELISLYHSMTDRYGDIQKQGSAFLKEIMNGISLYALQ